MSITTLARLLPVCDKWLTNPVRGKQNHKLITPCVFLILSKRFRLFVPRLVLGRKRYMSTRESCRYVHTSPTNKNIACMRDGQTRKDERERLSLLFEFEDDMMLYEVKMNGDGLGI